MQTQTQRRSRCALGRGFWKPHGTKVARMNFAKTSRLGIGCNAARSRVALGKHSVSLDLMAIVSAHLSLPPPIPPVPTHGSTAFSRASQDCLGPLSEAVVPALRSILAKAGGMPFLISCAQASCLSLSRVNRVESDHPRCSTGVLAQQRHIAWSPCCTSFLAAGRIPATAVPGEGHLVDSRGCDYSLGMLEGEVSKPLQLECFMPSV